MRFVTNKSGFMLGGNDDEFCMLAGLR